jgi:predicted nucleic acid-binding protein
MRLRDETYVDAPSLIDLEFLNVVRGLVARSRITLAAAEESVARFLAAPIERHRHQPLVWRAWQLRANLTAYGASYVALAEALGTVLLTVDRRIQAAPGIRCRVELAG